MAKVLLVQLGSPASPKVGDVRRFLREFLGDPRVVDLPALFWRPILWFFVLPFRPFRSAKAYRRIWNKQRGFPLNYLTGDFAQTLNSTLKDKNIQVERAFLLDRPRLAEALEKASSQEFTLVVPLFPQYSESTTASALDALAKALEKKTSFPPFKFVTSFHTSRAFIDHSVARIETHLQKRPADALVISFHGIPKRRVLEKGDPYYRQCLETFQLIRSRMDGVPPGGIHLTFQSRFGTEEWLTPYTDQYCLSLVREGKKRLAIYCPSFVTDCLETIDEIGHELAEEVRGQGGEVSLIPCLNADRNWCRDFALWLEERLTTEKDTLNYQPPTKDEKPMPEMTAKPLNSEQKRTLKIVFLTLFLDLVGFSIIFPLFPALADHYLTMDGDNPLLRMLFTGIEAITGGDAGSANLVLFGGALGALYSLMQFLAAPVWGIISDRIGRKPVLLISCAFLAVSYGIWFFAGTFTLLVLGRFIGGIMSGNISTATAVVGDITGPEQRSRGMAIVGIAFATGFVIGPALGGLLSLIDLNAFFPTWGPYYGINPFSAPAAAAGLLSLSAFILLWKKFKETLPAEKRGKGKRDRTINPLILFRPLPIPGINLTNFGHFLFLCAFSGMEFTLTFLAVERLAYSSLDNAYMFIFIGAIIALVQGGYVRRKAHSVGERKMALQGLLTILPGLICLNFAGGSALLYTGLFFLSVGSAMAIPTLTSLISLYAPPERQGLAVGVFRSLGALARVIGPIAASIIYWKYGAGQPYIWGALLMIIPIAMVAVLPKPPKRESPLK